MLKNVKLVASAIFPIFCVCVLFVALTLWVTVAILTHFHTNIMFQCCDFACMSVLFSVISLCLKFSLHVYITLILPSFCLVTVEMVDYLEDDQVANYEVESSEARFDGDGAFSESLGGGAGRVRTKFPETFLWLDSFSQIR